MIRVLQHFKQSRRAIQRFSLVVASVLFVGTMISTNLQPVVHAQLTSDQITALNEDIYYFNTEVCSTIGADADLVGSDNAEQAFNFFVQKGLSPEQAAGILGNLAYESGSDKIDPNSHQGGGGPGRGIAQWTVDERWVTLQKYAADKLDGADIWALKTQLLFLWHEFETTENAAYKGIKAANTVEEATAAFQNLFERPADRTGTLAIRISKAKKFLKLYGGTAVASQDQEDGDAADNNDDSADNLTSGCGGVNAGGSLGQGKGKFTDGDKKFPGVDEMLAKAKAVSDLKGATFRSICGSKGSTNCKNMCDYLMGSVWGYANSGYASAAVHWDFMKSSVHGHPNDRNPPVGALLFYKTSSIYGHIAVYLGNNLILSNDVLDAKSGVTGGAYITDASAMESGPWRLTYLGWSDPVFAGGKR